MPTEFVMIWGWSWSCRCRSRKNEQMFGEGSRDAELPYETELTREMFSSLDKVIQEIALRFQLLHELAEKYAFLTPSNLLDDKYERQLDHVHDDIDTEDVFVEGRILRQFIAVAATQDLILFTSVFLYYIYFLCSYVCDVYGVVSWGRRHKL